MPRARKLPRSLDPGGCPLRGFCSNPVVADFMEVCVFSQICSNSAELFQVGRGEPFVCDLSRSRFRELQSWLLETPDWQGPHGTLDE